MLDVLVQSADALSGARPGARKEMLQSYVKRLEDLENIANGFNGVEKSYAIQAGRDLRIIVDSHRINDNEATLLSRDIAKAVEEQLTYPGQIRGEYWDKARIEEVLVGHEGFKFAKKYPLALIIYLHVFIGYYHKIDL